MNEAQWRERSLTGLSGRTIAVTGATGSLGACVVKGLASLGARVVLIARSRARAEALLSSLPGADASVALCDMSELQTMRDMAATLNASLDRLDALVHVAGIFRQPKATTRDGFELTYQVNALAPVLMTSLLLPALLRAPSPRVIAMTSLSAYYARVDWDDPTALRVADPTDRYARTKRLLTLGMAQLARETGVAAVHVHPGVSATNLFSVEKGAYSARFLRVALPVMRRVFMPPGKASLSALYACCRALPSQTLVAPRGLLQAWGYPAVMRLPKALRDEAQARRALDTMRAQL